MAKMPQGLVGRLNGKKFTKAKVDKDAIKRRLNPLGAAKANEQAYDSTSGVLNFPGEK